MRFTVTWQRDAEEKLAGIWAVSKDRQEIAESANQIDRLLRLEGDRVGIEFLDYEFLAVGPLAVIFSRSLEDRLVETSIF